MQFDFHGRKLVIQPQMAPKCDNFTNFSQSFYSVPRPSINIILLLYPIQDPNDTSMVSFCSNDLVEISWAFVLFHLPFASLFLSFSFHYKRQKGQLLTISVSLLFLPPTKQKKYKISFATARSKVSKDRERKTYQPSTTTYHHHHHCFLFTRFMCDCLLFKYR